MDFPKAETLGSRIMICGPSNSGKSTLARALERRLGLPAVYLDLLRHLPNTNWKQRPDQDFEALHAEAIAGDRWVIEGNYSRMFPQRLARATGIMLLGDEPWHSLFRYARRTLVETGHRAGQLEGGEDRLNWQMVRWIMIAQPPKRGQIRSALAQSGLPMVEPASMRELKGLYEAWGLER